MFSDIFTGHDSMKFMLKNTFCILVVTMTTRIQKVFFKLNLRT